MVQAQLTSGIELLHDLTSINGAVLLKQSSKIKPPSQTHFKHINWLFFSLFTTSQVFLSSKLPCFVVCISKKVSIICKNLPSGSFFFHPLASYIRQSTKVNKHTSAKYITVFIRGILSHFSQLTQIMSFFHPTFHIPDLAFKEYRTQLQSYQRSRTF